MTLEMILTLCGLIGILFLLLAMGVEVAWSVGIAALIAMVFITGQPITRLAMTSWGVLNSFIMTAVPLFILMGALLQASGVAERLFLGLEKWMGHFPGGKELFHWIAIPGLSAGLNSIRGHPADSFIMSMLSHVNIACFSGISDQK